MTPTARQTRAHAREATRTSRLSRKTGPQAMGSWIRDSHLPRSTGLRASSPALNVVRTRHTMSHSGLSILGPGEAAQSAAGQPALSPPHRVLVVEDDPAICSALSEALREEGFDVLSAANGLAALDQLRAGPPPSAIVLDLMMPVMDGWDFRSVQLQDPGLRDIPVVVVTAAGFSVRDRPDAVRRRRADLEAGAARRSAGRARPRLPSDPARRR